MKTRHLVPTLIAALALAALGGLPARAQKASTTPAYTISSVGPIGNTWSRPYAVNDRGQVVGQSYLTSNSGWAFVYDAATGVQILPPLAGSSKAEADAINHSGQVVGYCTSPAGSISGFLWDSANGTRQLDRIPDSTGATAASLGWSIEAGRTINSSGDILCLDLSGQLGLWRMATNPSNGDKTLTVTPVPNVSGWRYVDLNDNGVVLTDAWNPSAGANTFGLWSSSAGVFNTFIDPSFKQGYALNNLGVAVSHYGQIYRPGAGITSLGSLGSGSSSANDVNDANQVVGFSGKGGTNVAFLWQNGVMQNLQSLTNAGSAWNLAIASGMSNPVNAAGTAGYIVGWGSYKNQAVGWMLAPK